MVGRGIAAAADNRRLARLDKMCRAMTKPTVALPCPLI
jgi:hypothetical protein